MMVDDRGCGAPLGCLAVVTTVFALLFVWGVVWVLAAAVDVLKGL